MFVRNKDKRNRWLRPGSIVFAITALYFLWIAVYVARESSTPNGRDADVVFDLFDPFFLLVAAFLIWRRWLWGYAAALLIAGWITYQGFRGYRNMAVSSGLPAASRRAFVAFVGEFFQFDHLWYAIEIALALVILGCAFVSFGRELYRQTRVHAHGI